MEKIGIIGAGPIGLYIASKLEEINKEYFLIEANETLGGQITNLYPNKTIVDIPGIDAIIAHKYIEQLISKIDLNKVIFSTEIIDIKEDNKVLVYSKDTQYEFDKLIICTGLGFYKPRPLGLEGEEGVQNILYSIKDFSFLKNKKVAIFGGGDSALDWAKEISAISDNVTLIHRRDEFRGNKDTIKDCYNLKVMLSYVPHELKFENNKATSILIKSVKNAQIESLDVDYILVNFGSLPANNHFGFESNARGILSENLKLTNNIFVCGDALGNEGKIKRIAPGLEEANLIISYLKN